MLFHRIPTGDESGISYNEFEPNKSNFDCCQTWEFPSNLIVYLQIAKFLYFGFYNNVNCFVLRFLQSKTLELVDSYENKMILTDKVEFVHKKIPKSWKTWFFSTIFVRRYFKTSIKNATEIVVGNFFCSPLESIDMAPSEKPLHQTIRYILTKHHLFFC